MIRRKRSRGWTVLVVPDQGQPKHLRLGPLLLGIAVLFFGGLLIGAVGAPVMLAGSVATNVALLAERTKLQFNQLSLETQLRNQKADLTRQLNTEQAKVRDLTSQAKEMTGLLGELQSRITAVEERAGITRTRRTSTRDPKGGGNTQELNDPFEILATLKTLTNRTENNFNQALGPLEAEMQREAAIPGGMPTSGRFTSKFGVRLGPRTGRLERHTGWDIATDYGRAVTATAPGVVETSSFSNVGYGLHIVIDHGYGLKTLYGHLSSSNVSAGQRIEAGDLIGRVGSTGNSTGPHLHYEVRKNGNAINPGPYLMRARPRYSTLGNAKP